VALFLQRVANRQPAEVLAHRSARSKTPSPDGTASTMAFRSVRGRSGAVVSSMKSPGFAAGKPLSLAQLPPWALSPFRDLPSGVRFSPHQPAGRDDNVGARS
jgi:hypothetical protein